MLLILLALVVALVAWSLHLMQEAVHHREFSLMLAGTLVAFSAAALLGVYFLVGNYVGYLAQTAQRPVYSTAIQQPWLSVPATLSAPGLTASELPLVP
jgi:Co/Zn/Cd efflux system component